MDCRRDTEPHIFEEPVGDDEKDFLHYIANMETGTVVGFKYFDFKKPVCLNLRLRGNGNVWASACLDAPDTRPIAGGSVALNGDWGVLTLDTRAVQGVHALYIRFETDAPAQFESLQFE